MRSPISLLSVVILIITLCWTRISYSELRGWTPMKVTTWDAFGYYQYLPAAFIAHDVERQAWVEGIDSSYQVIGTGGLYQLMELPNGNRATKYLCGTALLELPFFLAGHAIAGAMGAPQDGFSPPYQWAIALAPLCYCILALFLLRHVLLHWYTDATVALTLVLVVLATNAVQYISVDGAQTHGFLFALYCVVLWTTAKWHEAPRQRWAILIGATIGLAVVTRPTELVMLFLPLLWNTHTRDASAAKWALVRAHRRQRLRGPLAPEPVRDPHRPQRKGLVGDDHPAPRLHDLEAPALRHLHRELLGRRFAGAHLIIHRQRSAPGDALAYDMWLRGHQLTRQWSTEADTQAMQLFEQASEIDPGLACAYASMASVLNTQGMVRPGYEGDAADRKRANSAAKAHARITQCYGGFGSHCE